MAKTKKLLATCWEMLLALQGFPYFPGTQGQCSPNKPSFPDKTAVSAFFPKKEKVKSDGEVLSTCSL